MQIDWWTFALQAINFLVLIWLLHRFLFGPVKNIVEKRRVVAEQAFADADKMKNQAALSQAHFEAAEAGLVEERQAMLHQAHEVSAREREQLLDAAKAEADQLLAAARETVQAERRVALEELHQEVVALAKQLAAGILKDSGSTVPNPIILERFEQQITAMRSEDREHLRRDLGTAKSSLRVITSQPLSDDERKQWSDHLNRSLGISTAFEFFVDGDLIGGAELHFPHSVLTFTWANQLDKASELLCSDKLTD